MSCAIKVRRKVGYLRLSAAGWVILLVSSAAAFGWWHPARHAHSEKLPDITAEAGAAPQNSEQLLVLLASELQRRQVDQARGILARIRQRFPSDANLAYESGLLLLEHNLPHEAEAEFKRSAAILIKAGGLRSSGELTLSDVYLQMARLEFDEGDYWSALGDFGKINLQRVAPSLQPSALHLEGQSLVGVGRAQEAVVELTEAAQMNRSNPEYLVHLAWAEILAGEIRAAASVVELAASKRPDVPDVRFMQALVKRDRLPGHPQVPYSQKWHLKGEGLVCCPCRTPCPCRSNAPPTYGHCENAGFTHISRGHYGNISLAGISFVTVYDSMNPRRSSSVFYIDQSATAEQVVALERLMQSFTPLQPAFLNVQRSRILYHISADKRTYGVRIPGILHMRIRREVNGEGQPFYRTAALDDFSNVIEYSQNLIYKIWGPEGRLKLDDSDRQANFRFINLDYADYQEGKMLKQFADGSGYFNRKEMELIREFRLPTLVHQPKPSKQGLNRGGWLTNDCPEIPG
ncbi:MAG: DUF1326 domain-containing protein [Terriglobia bacterium]